VRFFFVAIFVYLLGFAIIFLEYGVFEFPDTDLPPYPAPTALQVVCDTLLSIVGLPIAAFGFLCDKLGVEPRGVFCYLLLLTPGLFWAFIVEFLIRARRRYVA
jgi:hypothetical protein